MDFILLCITFRLIQHVFYTVMYNFQGDPACIYTVMYNFQADPACILYCDV